MTHEVEDLFPEIAKSMQHRRAQYYLLKHEGRYVANLQKHGKLDENDAKGLASEIDKKIHNLKLQATEIALLPHAERIS